MTPKRPQKILAEFTSEGLESRAQEAERLYIAAIGGGGAAHVRVVGAAGAGLSELLKQTYDRLITDQRFVVPFYFALRPEDLTARQAASRFAYEFLVQAIASRRREPQLLLASPDICELKKLSPLSDARWVDSICETCDSDSVLNDANAFIRTALASPFRAAVSAGFRVALIADDLHNVAAIEGGQTFLNWLSSFGVPAGSSMLLAGRRSVVVDRRDIAVIAIDRPTAQDAGAIASRLAIGAQVNISESVRDLIVASTGRRLPYIRSIISAARDARLDLTTYRDAARVYSTEVVEGSIAAFLLRATGPEAGLIEALSSAISINDPFAIRALRDRIRTDDLNFDQLIKRLAANEIIEMAGETARLSSDRVLSDFLAAQSAILSGRSTAAAAASRVGTAFLQAAPAAMSREYRRASSVGLADILSAFDGRNVPLAAIDHRAFRETYKGLSDAEIRERIAVEADTFTLPQIVRSGELRDFAPRFESPLESERLAAGVGFAGRSYRDEDAVVWIAAELDSKLEADPELVREWLVRLDEAAADAAFERHRIWLVTPEGFSPGAAELLAERGAVGSSRHQVQFLKEILAIDTAAASAGEYEMTIPVGDEAELVAVHAVEDIARRAAFPAKAINQIKTALVEACINASEHGLAPDRKIHLKFASFDDRLELSVSNRGLRLADRMAAPLTGELSTDSRRGWGLGLMRNLMDDVRVESVDDGTRIVMTKLRPIE